MHQYIEHVGEDWSRQNKTGMVGQTGKAGEEEQRVQEQSTN